MNKYVQQVLKLKTSLRPCGCCGSLEFESNNYDFDDDIIRHLVDLSELTEDKKCPRLEGIITEYPEVQNIKLSRCAIDRCAVTANGIRLCNMCKKQIQNSKLPKLSLFQTYLGSGHELFANITFA